MRVASTVIREKVMGIFYYGPPWRLRGGSPGSKRDSDDPVIAVSCNLLSRWELGSTSLATVTNSGVGR
jgi:hypothetical protein